MNRLSRRDFLKCAVAAGAGGLAAPAWAAKRSATDMVTLGYRTTGEIDEVIERINRHLNA
jgi:hypothetical protein